MLLTFKNQNYNLPDFFIVGAPKCGTTALTNYLAQHPQIYMPHRKELHHFATDLYATERRQFDKNFYYSFFKNITADKISGDASVFHLYSKEAAANIFSFNPDARIIIMLRNPVDMIYSYHSQLLFNGDEDIEVFEDALQAEKERKNNNRIPKHVNFRSMLFYSDVVKYSEQVKRYLDTFQAEQVMVITYDDFKDSTEELYKNVLRYLGADDSFEANFKIINPNKVTRYKILRSFYGKTPALVESAGRLILPSKKLRKKILRKLRSVNTKKVQRKPLDPGTREALKQEFEADIKKLELILERDLSAWYE